MRRFQEEEDEQELLDSANAHLRSVIVALLDTGCRIGEILSLQRRDVNLKRRELVIVATKTKTRVARIVPISSRLMAILEIRKLGPDGQSLGRDAYVFGNEVGERSKSIRTAWKNACERAGLVDFRVHDLRHEAGSRFDEAGVPLSYVSKILGHSNLSTTSRYLNTQRRGLQSAVQRVEEHQREQAERRNQEQSHEENTEAQKTTVAQSLHSETPDSPAVVPLSNDSPVRNRLLL